MRGARGFAAGALALAAVTAGGCGSGPRQDANEPAGHFKLRVVSARFPTHQSLAQASKLRITVHNADHRNLPNVAVTVETHARGGGAPQAFAADIQDTNVADASRPIWILDSGPEGGTTAVTNTWALGPLGPGKTKQFTWRLTAVKAGNYVVGFRVSPGLTGKAKPAGNNNKGEFHVVIDNRPPSASVNDAGKVVEHFPSGGSGGQ
jgi:hypothetical protein